MNEQTVFIAAAPDAVWGALHDPQVLKKAIPGCEEVSRKGPTLFQVKAAVEIAFFRRVVNGTLRLDDEVPGQKMRMEANLRERAKGLVNVTLLPENGGTRVRYTITADVRINIAGLGDFVINRAAQKLGGQFFETIGSEVTKVA